MQLYYRNQIIKEKSIKHNSRHLWNKATTTTTKQNIRLTHDITIDEVDIIFQIN